MPHISLPDALHTAAEQLADQAGFRNADEYVAELVRRDLVQRQQQDPDLFLRQAMAENGDASNVTPEALAARKREIEALLAEGLASGAPLEVDDTFWEERRRVLRERIAARTKPEAP